MTKQIINIGSQANDRSGDPLRTAFDKINQNFTELYTTASLDIQIPVQTGNVGKYLTTNGSVLSWSTVTGGGGYSDRLASGDYDLVLDTDGHVNLSGGHIRQQIDNDLVIRVKDADDDGYRLDLIVVDDEDNTLTRVEVHRDGVEILTNLQGQTAHGWYFKDNGNLQLPAGGDIVDNNGTSVLGGSGADLGDLVIYDGAITTDGVSSIVIAPNGEGYGYVTVPNDTSAVAGAATVIGNSRDGGGGVQIAAHSNTWIFGPNGDLTLPAAGDILNSNGDSVLGGGSTSYTPDDTDNWNEPTINTISAALDELAARMTAFENFEIDGGNANTPALGELLIDGNGA